MTADSFCFYLQNRLVQTSQTGGQRYSITSPFSIPCFLRHLDFPAPDKRSANAVGDEKTVYSVDTGTPLFDGGKL